MLGACSIVGGRRRPKLILGTGVALLVRTRETTFVVGLIATVRAILGGSKVIFVLMVFRRVLLLEFLLLSLFFFCLLFGLLTDLADAIFLFHAIIQGEFSSKHAGFVDP
jgi:hypothetical protein